MVDELSIRGGGGVVLAPETVTEMRAGLPDAAAMALEVITAEVPEYAGTLDSEIGRTIQGAIAVALGAFLHLVEPDADADDTLDAARRGAYALGRGEARSGRSADALLGAYRLGARVSWREMSATAVAHDTPADVIARFAEMVFAYIDELSAASVAGHADEIAASGRLQRQRREQLGVALLAGASTAKLTELADEAAWSPPETLTAVVMATERVRDVVPHLDAATLVVAADELQLAHPQTTMVLLVPDAVRTRGQLLRALAATSAVVGPSRPWVRAVESLQIAARAQKLVAQSDGEVVDTTAHLATLVVGADPGALDDLRASVLSPLDELTPAAAERLAETLRAWFLHLGRRSEVAEVLHIHPQTVRYRMNQLRDLYGDRLDDPATVEALILALVPAAAAPTVP